MQNFNHQPHDIDGRLISHLDYAKNHDKRIEEYADKIREIELSSLALESRLQNLIRRSGNCPMDSSLEREIQYSYMQLQRLDTKKFELETQYNGCYIEKNTNISIDSTTPANSNSQMIDDYADLADRQNPTIKIVKNKSELEDAFYDYAGDIVQAKEENTSTPVSLTVIKANSEEIGSNIKTEFMANNQNMLYVVKSPTTDRVKPEKPVFDFYKNKLLEAKKGVKIIDLDNFKANVVEINNRSLRPEHNVIDMTNRAQGRQLELRLIS